MKCLTKLALFTALVAPSAVQAVSVNTCKSCATDRAFYNANTAECMKCLTDPDIIQYRPDLVAQVNAVVAAVAGGAAAAAAAAAPPAAARVAPPVPPRPTAASMAAFRARVAAPVVAAPAAAAPAPAAAAAAIPNPPPMPLEMQMPGGQRVALQAFLRGDGFLNHIATLAGELHNAGTPITQQALFDAYLNSQGNDIVQQRPLNFANDMYRDRILARIQELIDNDYT